MTNVVSGGYTVHPEVGAEELAVFKYAMKNLFGVDYKPLIVASQVVDGTNYLFVCTGKVIAPQAETGLYAVKIYTKFRHSVAPIVEIKEIVQIPVERLLELKTVK